MSDGLQNASGAAFKGLGGSGSVAMSGEEHSPAEEATLSSGPKHRCFMRLVKPTAARIHGQRQGTLLHVTELMLPPLSARIGPLSCGWAVFFLTLLATNLG